MSRSAHPYHHGDLRRALVVAAARVVRRQGAHRATLRAIARAAGVSQAAPYHHFRDRDGLLAAVAADGFRQLAAGMTEAAGRAPASGLERLRAAGLAYVRFAVANAEVYRLMFGGLLRAADRDAELAEAEDEAYATLARLLGGGGGGGAGTEAVQRTAWATVHGLSMLLLDGRLAGDRPTAAAADRLAREVTDVLGRGLRFFAPTGRSTPSETRSAPARR
jgi:AcrR family transcriptional regulator